MYELSQPEPRFAGRENLNVGANLAVGLALGLVGGAVAGNPLAGTVGGLLLANLANGIQARRQGNRYGELALAASVLPLVLYLLILTALASGLLPIV